MEISNKKLFIAVRCVIVAVLIFSKTLWAKMLMLGALFAVDYIEYSVSTPEERDRKRSAYFGRPGLFFLTIFILLAFLSYYMFPE